MANQRQQMRYSLSRSTPNLAACVSFSVHPGGIATDLIRHMSQAEIDASSILDQHGRPVDPENNKKSPQQGAATSVWCATSPQLEGMGGVYCADCDIAPVLPSDDSTELHGVRATCDRSGRTKVLTPLGI